MTTPIVEATHLTKRFGSTVALDDVSVSFDAETIYGLLGRNGAGKTTLMSILTAQNLATSGDVTVFGEHPYENAGVLSRLCFVRESQKYPDDARPTHAFAAARLCFANWDDELADRLIADFDLPVDTRIKKLSRGQFSAVVVIIGLASRAELTFFDEPYLGLDAVARQLFYDRLIEDYAEHPRTIVLSSHLIDEIADLLEKVVVIDRGRILIDEDADTLRARAFGLVGPAEAIDRFTAGREVLHRETLGHVASVTVLGALSVTAGVTLAAHLTGGRGNFGHAFLGQILGGDSALPFVVLALDHAGCEVGDRRESVVAELLAEVERVVDRLGGRAGHRDCGSGRQELRLVVDVPERDELVGHALQESPVDGLVAPGEDGRPTSAVGVVGGGHGVWSAEADDVAVGVDVDACCGGGLAQAGHGAHVSAYGVHEPCSDRGAYLAHGKRPPCRGAFECRVV